MEIIQNFCTNVLSLNCCKLGIVHIRIPGLSDIFITDTIGIRVLNEPSSYCTDNRLTKKQQNILQIGADERIIGVFED